MRRTKPTWLSRSTTGRNQGRDRQFGCLTVPWRLSQFLCLSVCLCTAGFKKKSPIDSYPSALVMVNVRLVIWRWKDTNLREEAKEKWAGPLGEKLRGLSKGLLPVKAHTDATQYKKTHIWWPAVSDVDLACKKIRKWHDSSLVQSCWKNCSKRARKIPLEKMLRWKVVSSNTRIQSIL